MSEEETPSPPAAVHFTQKRVAVRAARWAVELATVFVGVYAAFMLNNYQNHRQERQRREQILVWMDAEYSEVLEDVKRGRGKLQHDADEFNRAVDAGEMPAVYAFNFASDYDPADIASMLGNGGYDLLEIETVRELRDTEDTLRLMVGLARHDQQLSDTLVLPNLDKDRSVFYDPATRKLRPTYRWYADFFRVCLHDYDDLQPQIEKLLRQVRAERQRNR